MSKNNEDIYEVEDDYDYDYDPENNSSGSEKSSKSSNNDNNKSYNSGELVSKLIKYGIIIFVGLIVLLILVAVFFPKGKKSSSAVTTKELTLTSGEKYSLDYSKGSYTWSSSNQSIARVSDDGEIVAIKNGDTTITIKSNNETIAYKVHVDKVEDSVVITNVKMEKNTVEIEKGKTYDMKVTLTPSNATSTDLTWSSSDEKIATVKDGVITAVSPGSCMITVKSSNGNMDNCLVKVTGDGSYNPIESIKITSTEVSLYKGTSYELAYEINPKESANLVVWESSNNEIATVENGVVYALQKGTIDVTAKSGDIIETIKVTVEEEKVEPNYVLNQTSIGLKVGEGYTLSTNNGTKVNWSSNDSNIATVDSTGKVVAKAAGETVVVATDTTGFKAECIVTVTKESSQQSDVISLNTTSMSMNVGDSVKLIESVTPSNNVSGVTWSSSDAKIATVSNNGEVKAVSNGTATITASLANGSKAECVINVSTKVVNAALVKINVSNQTLVVGASSQLTATVLPSNTTNKTITWSSSNNEVATVDSNGKVTAKKKGSAIIYARTSNGVFGTCGIVVKDK